MTENGALTSIQLVTVQGTQQLEVATARDFRRWQTAATQAGFVLRLASPAGGYRSAATQADMRANPSRYNLAANGVSVAPVGASRHGQGRAVDVANCAGAFRLWCLRTAADYGFHLWTTKDPNHFEHGPALTTALPQPRGVIEMIGYNYNEPGKGSGTKALVDPVQMLVRYPPANERSAFEQSGGIWVNLNAAMWSEIIAPCRNITKPDSLSAGPSDAGAIAALAKQLVSLDAKVSAIRVPTKITGTLS